MTNQELVDAAVEFFIEGHPLSQCRGCISEYGVEGRELGSLMQMAQRQFEEWKLEVGKELRF